MSKRSRPRRYQRREAAAALHGARAVGAVRWANRALIGSMVAWALGVATAWAIVSVVRAQTFAWGFFGPSRTSNPPLELTVERAEVVPLAVVLLALPAVLGTVGWFRTRDGAEVVRQDGPTPLSVWSRAGAVAAVALVPNVLGCLWISATRSTESALMDLALAWPYIAAVFVPLAWEARILLRYRVGAR